MKILISVIGLINGGYMLIDGIFVLLNGKYIGPEKPGPWAALFSRMNINVFNLGPLFVLFGILWIGWLISLWTNQSYSFTYGIFISFFTLWYFPAGTLLSLILIALLLFAKKSIGL